MHRRRYRDILSVVTEDPKPPADPSAEQVRRAEALRRQVGTPGGARRGPPRTPREFTDEAAREEWQREQPDDGASAEDP